MSETVYERTHRVLMYLDSPRTVREISERLGIKYSAAYRCIARLMTLGFSIRAELRYSQKQRTTILHYWHEG